MFCTEQKATIGGAITCKLIALLALFYVGACSGGGGGGGGGPLNPIDTSLTDQKFSATFKASGSSITASESFAFTSSVLVPRSSASLVAVSPGATSVNLRLNQNFGQYVHNALYGPSDLIAFDGVRNFFQQSTGFLSSQSLIIIVPGPAASGLDYASYGIWETRTGSLFGTDMQGGALSYGILTEPRSMPTTGSASYNGFVNGYFGNARGSRFFLDGTAALNVDFAARTLTGLFTNFGMLGSSFSDVQADANIKGNGFNGVVRTLATPASVINPAMTGEINGNFFGPAAQEIGGVFRMSGSDGSSAVGGFAAKQ